MGTWIGPRSVFVMKVRKQRQRLRIIGGRWRGRRLEFANLPGLRPTPDRVRETLFNWLAPVIAGSRCLDLFAGSGALGLEAASRGAMSVTLVEADMAATRVLREQVETLQAEQVEVVNQDALKFLAQPRRAYDVIFLDPPFGRDLLAPSLMAIDRGQWLNVGGHLYLEAACTVALADIESWLPGGHELVRRKRAGRVAYYLVRLQRAGKHLPALHAP
jgi:16S rRNA (guanine966-N2)-methyltransferase